MFLIALLLCSLFIAAPLQARADELDLPSALQLARERNPAAGTIEESLHQAELLIDKAWAILLPRLNLDGNLTRNEREIALDFGELTAALSQLSGDPAPAASSRTVIQELWGRHAGLNASISLFNARSLPLLRYAYLNKDATAGQAGRSLETLLFAVSSAYRQAYASGELIEAARENEKNAQAFHRQAIALTSAGQGTRIDVLRAESLALSASRDLADSSDGNATALSALAALLDLDTSPTTLAMPAKPVLELPDETSAIDRALDQRSDLRSASMQVSLAGYLTQETWMKWAPNVDLTYAWAWDSATGFSGEHDTWRIILGASWQLFDGGLRSAELAERESALRVARNQHRQLYLSVREEVRKAWLEVKKRERHVGLAEKQLELATENHRLVHLQYEVGLATSLEVSDAAAKLASARTGVILERLQRDLAVLALGTAMGRQEG
ncbi:MAG: hypothetical protein A2284_08570 [Deltaproteobacteria bacterium RIFOXYA12_FULL_61_11]|nr:MAG: hypothetical protein A2284_08570 [Deltaproteobacteria bacterium RIFOXYA12_FULL_61_11]